MDNAFQEQKNMSVIALRVMVERIATKILGLHAKKLHADMAEHAKKIVLEISNVSALATTLANFARRLSKNIYYVRRTRV
jgi:hypothetical protein